MAALPAPSIARSETHSTMQASLRVTACPTGAAQRQGSATRASRALALPRASAAQPQQQQDAPQPDRRALLAALVAAGAALAAPQVRWRCGAKHCAGVCHVTRCGCADRRTLPWSCAARAGGPGGGGACLRLPARGARHARLPLLQGEWMAALIVAIAPYFVA